MANPPPPLGLYGTHPSHPTPPTRPNRFDCPNCPVQGSQSPPPPPAFPCPTPPPPNPPRFFYERFHLHLLPAHLNQASAPRSLSRLVGGGKPLTAMLVMRCVF